jgi:hypothetical protein
MPAKRTHNNPHWKPRPDFIRNVPLKPAKPSKFRFNSVEGLADFIVSADLPEVTVYDTERRQSIALDIAQTLFRPKHAKGKSDARKIVQAYIDGEHAQQADLSRDVTIETPETSTQLADINLHSMPTVYVGFQQLSDGSTIAFRSDSQPSRVPA